jgi:hypothetical protein
MGSAVASALAEPDDVVKIEIEENELRAECEIDPSVKDALQVPEAFAPDEPVEVVGKIVEMDKRNLSFKIEAASRTFTVEVNEWQFRKVDSELRWERVFVSGHPRDSKGKAVHSISGLRAATPDEEDGFNLTRELRRGEGSEAYQQVSTRVEKLLALNEGWDTYEAKVPNRRASFFALHFLRDAIGVLLDHGISVPTPFLVPTASGGVQLEWRIGPRELELEIPEKGRFEFLAVDGSSEVEGAASRWTAFMPMRWRAMPIPTTSCSGSFSSPACSRARLASSVRASSRMCPSRA